MASFAKLFESAQRKKKEEKKKREGRGDGGGGGGKKKEGPASSSSQQQQQRAKGVKRKRPPPTEEASSTTARLVPREQQQESDDDRRGNNNNRHNHKKRKGGGGSGRGNGDGRRNDSNHNQRQQRRLPPPPHARKRPRPSEEALALSAKLKDLSQRKRLKEALELYYEKKGDDAAVVVRRDCHHACIVVDCCSRCGDIASAERIVDELEEKAAEGDNNSGTSTAERRGGGAASIELYTALLKGYAHAGELHKAEALFTKLCRSSPPSSKSGNSNQSTDCRPNIRTLNTVLRGCLWTAASSSTSSVEQGGTSNMRKNENDAEIAGGVVTSERIWKLFRETVIVVRNDDDSKGNPTRRRRHRQETAASFDLSSYEYSISLLCQALDTEAATRRISDLLESSRIKLKGKANFASTAVPSPARGGGSTDASAAAAADNSDSRSASVMETIAASYLALARAYALSGDVEMTWTSCQRVLNAVNLARVAGSRMNNDIDYGANGHRLEQTTKSSKKRNAAPTGGKTSWKRNRAGDTSVDEGNREVRRIDSNVAFRSHRLAEFEMEARRLLKARGRQSVPLARALVLDRLLNRVFYFSGRGTTGLVDASVRPLPKTSRPNEATKTNKSIGEAHTASWHSFGGSMLSKDGVLVDLRQGAPDQENGRLDFERIFKNKTARPIEIELGAGFGDWIVGQAQSNPSRNHVAVELRADRVYQIFSKSIIDVPDPLDNLLVVGCDAHSFLYDRVTPSTISAIFVHHPEPPTQTFGLDDRFDIESIMKGGPEPAHMLSSNTLLAAANCLRKKDGELVIVTDNWWYARLICATLIKVLRKHKGLLLSLPANEVNGLRRTESLGNGVVLYEGENPSAAAIAHRNSSRKDASTSGRSTWFDRLWQTGAGSHAERKKRFVIAMRRGR